MDAPNPLRKALGLATLELHYQGQYRLADGRLDGLETLLRGRDGTGHVAPARIVERAAAIGLGHALALWSLDAALEGAHDLAAAGTRAALRVNFMEAQIADPALVRAVIARLPPRHAIEIELVETRRNGDLRVLARGLQQLREAGIRVWVDDYTGSGADLARILAAPMIDGVKLDKGLLHANAFPSHKAALARLKAMLEGGGLEVLAEGIETPVHLALAKSVGFGLGQGYLMHVPEPLSGFIERHAARNAAQTARAHDPVRTTDARG